MADVTWQSVFKLFIYGPEKDKIENFIPSSQCNLADERKREIRVAL